MNEPAAEIVVEEIPLERIDTFWQAQMQYLVEDGIITQADEIAYFSSEAYRGMIRAHMLRAVDRHHMVTFCRAGQRIGAAQYNTYQSEDGKCFVLDFWVFPPFRGGGTGKACFRALEQYTKKDGALYYELNCDRENAARFWQSLGFVEHGIDEYGVALWIRK